jgi:hypothetical protein
MNFSIELSREMTIQIFTIVLEYRESWPKFEQVTKNLQTPRTLELFAFVE